MRPHLTPLRYQDISGVASLSPVLSIVYVAVIPFHQLAERAKPYMYADRAADDSNILALGLPVASSLATLYRAWTSCVGSVLRSRAKRRDNILWPHKSPAPRCRPQPTSIAENNYRSHATSSRHAREINVGFKSASITQQPHDDGCAYKFCSRAQVRSD